MPGIPGEVEAILAEDRFLRSLARSLLGDEPDVDDAVQHTWLRGLLHPPRNAASIRGFLGRILRNRVRNLRRDERRRARHEQAAARPEALPSAGEMVEKEELRRRVGQAVLALEEPYRTTVWLRFREELPPREVAERMGVPVATVQTRLRRALERMRCQLDSSYGDRGTWALLLVPAGDRSRSTATGAATALAAGGMTMKKVLAAAVAALVLGLAVGGMLFLGAEPALPGRPDPSRALAGGVPDDPAPIGRMPVVPTSGEVPATPVHGVLLHADGTPAARVPFWVWEDPAPPWTRVPDRSRFVYGWSLPEVPEGRTGIEGEWRIESGDAAAVTFVPFETIMVSYELDGQDSTEGGVRWDLPPFALSHFEILGLRPDEHWMVQLWPTVDPSEDPGDTTPESGPHLLVPHGEDGQRAALSLLGSSGDTGRRLTGPSRVSFVTIPGRTYQREVIGVGFETEQPPLDYFMAPFAESLRIARRGPKVTVRVMEAGGVIATGEEGRVVYWKERDRQFGRMDWPLRSGRADFGWGCFPAEVPHEVRVVMADGEQFSGAFRFSPGEMERVLTFERGQGSLPTLSVVLPDDADLTACTVVFEDHRGQFDDVKPYGKQMFDLIAIGRKTEATFTESGSHTLRLNKMPDGWVQLWVLTPAGRVANLRNPGSAGTVRVPWLPDTELEALDLHQPIDEGALRPGSDFLFRIEFTTTSGEVRMRTVDRFDSTADTYLWPVWRKRVPEGMGYRVFAFGSGGRAEFDLQRR